MIRVGTSGWSYADWEGIVYPREKPAGFHPLAHLARFVDCVEINSSFYAPSNPRHAERWVELTREHPEFRFTAKLLSDFTHGPAPQVGDENWATRAGLWCAGLAPLVEAGCLDAVLAQFAVSFKDTVLARDRLERLASRFGPYGLVAELRHRSWFTAEAREFLSAQGYSLAHIDLPAHDDHPPDWHEPTGPIGYLRLHGRNSGEWFRREAERDDRYDYLYGPEELAPLVKKARRLAGETDKTYVLTNNHFEGQALANALELSAALQGEAVLAPAELVARYPQLEANTRTVGQRELF